MKVLNLIVLLFISLTLTTVLVYAGDAEKGKALFNDVSLGTNGKSCNSCHPNGKDIDGGKETFTIFGKQQSSVEDAVNFCIEAALKGKSLDKNSEEMKNIVSYVKTLGEKKKLRKSVMPGY